MSMSATNKIKIDQFDSVFILFFFSLKNKITRPCIHKSRIFSCCLIDQYRHPELARDPGNLFSTLTAKIYRYINCIAMLNILSSKNYSGSQSELILFFSFFYAGDW